jgi:hypothetical protein
LTFKGNLIERNQANETLDRFADLISNDINRFIIDLKDFNYLSLLDLFYLISKINKVIFCDIKDKFGKINEEIKSMDYDHDESTILLGLKHGTYKLTDNFFYKLIYIFKSDTYSLDIESEYHEKINLEK